jgi:hypothetical protein
MALGTQDGAGEANGRFALTDGQGSLLHVGTRPRWTHPRG